MAADPNISRNIFNSDKRYFGVRLQQGVPIFDWDINESYDEIVWFMQAYWHTFCGSSGQGVRFNGSNGAKGFTLAPIGLSNDILIVYGSALVQGRLVYNVQNFEYDEDSNTPTNYIVTGTVSSILETTPQGDYTITDSEQSFTANHDLSGAIIRFTSGVESGNEFEISTSPSSTDLQILDDLSSVVVTDTFVIKPRRLVTPPGPSDQTDTFKLVTWFENISSVQDADLIDLTPADVTLHVEPSQRRQLRWCVYANWTGTDGTDTTNDFFSLDLGSVTRPQGQAVVDNLTDVENYAHIATYFTRTLDGHKSIFEEEFDWETSKSSSVSYDFATTSNTLPRTININEGKYITSYFSLNINNPAVVTKESETFVNSTTGASWKMLDVSGANVSDTQGAVGPALDDLIYLSIEDDGSNIINAFPMGEIPEKQGFDWILQKASGNLTVMPGQLRVLGKILQLPRELTRDVTNINNYITSTSFLGTDDWGYVYLIFDPTTSRSLDVKFDLIEPLYNGSHPNITSGVHGFCIGFFRLGPLGTVDYDTACRNNKVFLAQTGISNFVSVANQPSSGVLEALIDMPVGASTTTLNINAVNIIATKVTLDIINKHNITTTFDYEEVINISGASSATSESRTIEVPCNFGDLKGSIDYAAWTNGSLDFQVTNISYQYNYMPKPNLWSI